MSQVFSRRWCAVQPRDNPFISVATDVILATRARIGNAGFDVGGFGLHPSLGFGLQPSLS